jgi:hypothetical protein
MADTDQDSREDRLGKAGKPDRYVGAPDRR